LLKIQSKSDFSAVVTHDNWKAIFILILLISLIIRCISASKYQFHFDDAFIAFRVSEVFAATGVPSFFKTDSIFTSTSVLYPIWNSIFIFSFKLTWIHYIAYVNILLQGLAYTRIAFVLAKDVGFSFHWFIGCCFIVVLSFSPSLWVVANTGLETSMFQLVVAFSILPGESSRWAGWFSIFVRPDGLLLGVSNLVCDFIKKKSWKIHMRYAALAAIAWVCITWFWYGTVIPQSIMAKSNHAIDRVAQIQKGLEYLFFQDYGIYSCLIGSGLYTFKELRSHFQPMLIWIGLHVATFSLLGSWWAWYAPPILIPMLYMAALALIKWISFLEERGKPVVKFTFAGLLLLLVFESTSAWKKLSTDGQANAKRIESSKQIGTWLSSKVKQNECVMLEPLGMIAYFAPDVRFVDYPGLASREMSAFLKSLPWKIPIQLTESRTNEKVVAHFRPDWIVLFPYELEAMHQAPSFVQNYRLHKVMDYYPIHARFKNAHIYKRKLQWVSI
jgi:hypothetical protein